MGTNDNNNNEHPLIQDNRVLSVSLSIAQAWVQFFIKAYDALLHHNINYRQLPEFKDPKGLMRGAMNDAESMEKGQSKFLEYLENLGSAIDAAIRRAGFKKV